ncbi:MAG: hypothetical protein HYZ29_10500 [Myxococcales bacterium]|nr:hypothetical protein [Myxococcales bacterium]
MNRAAQMSLALATWVAAGTLVSQRATGQPAEEPPPPPAPSLDAPPPPPPEAPLPASGPVREFQLKNGTSVKGRVVREQPGDWLMIETESGWRLTLPWQHVGAPPPAASPASAAQRGDAPPNAPAAAPEPTAARTGFRLGARAAAAFPVGKTEAGEDRQLSRVFGTALPLTLDVGAQVSPSFYVGVYGSWVVGSAGTNADAACAKVDCSVYGARVGLDLELRLAQSGSPLPWLSYAFGWSADEIDLEGGGKTQQHAYGGLDFATLLAGADFKVGDHLAVGPFGGVGLSLYLYEVDAVDGTGRNKAVSDPAVHGYIQAGVRGVLFP